MAVDDNWNIIAIVNHTTGFSASLSYSTTKPSEYLGILFFISIPGVLAFFISKKAFESEKYHDVGWYIIGAGLLIILLVLNGVNKQYSDSKDALKEIS